MRRLCCNVIALSGLLLLMTCSRITLPPVPIPTGIVLYAQAAPTSIHATWNVNPPDQNITQYALQLDGVVAVTVPPNQCTDGVCRTAVTIPVFGKHTVAVNAVNITLSGDPGVVGTPVAGPASSLSFTLSPSATVVTGLGVGQE